MKYRPMRSPCFLPQEAQNINSVISLIQALHIKVNCSGFVSGWDWRCSKHQSLVGEDTWAPVWVQTPMWARTAWRWQRLLRCRWAPWGSEQGGTLRELPFKKRTNASSFNSLPFMVHCFMIMSCYGLLVPCHTVKAYLSGPVDIHRAVQFPTSAEPLGQ